MRISTQLVLLLIFLNGIAGAMTASGAADAMGIAPDVGGGTTISDTESAADSFDASGGFGSTLFTLFTAVGGLFSTIYNLVFYGPVMLENLGIPGFAVGIFNAGLAVIVAADVAGILAGRDI